MSKDITACCVQKCVASADQHTSAQTTEASKLSQVTVDRSDQTTEPTHQPSMSQANAPQSEETLTTSQEVKLYKMLRNVQLKLTRCKNRGRKHLKTLKAAQNIMTNKVFMEVVENMTSARKILNLLQCKKQKRSRRTSRFTFNENITSLSIYTQSPKAYQFLTKIFLLPESKTLDNLIKKIIITPGINNKLLKNLKNTAKTMMREDRLCMLLFDEVAIQPSMSYSVLDDKIDVFKKEGSSVKFASHVVVFMLKGLFKNYIQPIVYAVSSESTKAVELKKIIQNIIDEVRQARFVVVATVCKQGTNNQEAIECLIEDTKMDKLKSGEEHTSNTFFVGKLEIIPLYDPPNLLKDFRNNLLSMPLQHENKDGKICTAKWEHIQMIYDVNLKVDESYRVLYRLIDQHVIPGKINKMKVEFASQVFSHKVATYMYFNSLNGPLPSECNDTAYLILLIDQLFDSMNGSPGRSKIDCKPLLGPLKRTTRCQHFKKWPEAKTAFRSMELLNGNNIHVPTIKKYLWNIEAFEYLSSKMAIKYGIRSIWPRRLNQDPLEKFLGPSHVMADLLTSEDQAESNQPLI